MRKLMIVLSAVILSSSAFGWGRAGHEAIAKIAENNLSHRARVRIERYLGGHSIVYYAKWMDDYRRTPEYAFTSPWHVAPVDSTLHYPDGAPGKNGDAVFGLEQAVEALRDMKSLSDSAIAVNIKYIIHLVGDMHCPAHIVYASHNMKYNVMFEDVSHVPHKFNIHTVWDNEVINVSRIWSSTEWAGELDRCDRRTKRSMAEGTPREWLHDNAVRCEVQFDWAQPDMRLGQDFLNLAVPLVESQILHAGYRLAALLDSLF